MLPNVTQLKCACLTYGWQGDTLSGLTIMGIRVATTGSGVAFPMSSRESTTLKAGSRVFTVWVSEIATAAKERLAAT